MTELEGSGNGGDDPAAPFIGQAGRTWQSTGICGGGGAGRATGAGQGGDAAAGWGMGLPPPGGGRAGHSRVDVDAPPSLDRLEMAPMEDIGNGAEEGGAQGSSGSEGSGCKGTSTEQLLSGAFSTLRCVRRMGVWGRRLTIVLVCAAATLILEGFAVFRFSFLYVVYDLSREENEVILSRILVCAYGVLFSCPPFFFSFPHSPV